MQKFIKRVVYYERYPNPAPPGMRNDWSVRFVVEGGQEFILYNKPSGLHQAQYEFSNVLTVDVIGGEPGSPIDLTKDHPMTAEEILAMDVDWNDPRVIYAIWTGERETDYPPIQLMLLCSVEAHDELNEVIYPISEEDQLGKFLEP